MDLSRDDFIRDQFAKHRIRKQVAGPADSGQMSLGFDSDTPPPLVEGTTLHSPEQQDINRRGMAMVRGIFASRSGSFTAGQTPAPYTEHHDGAPPCIGC